MIVVLTDDQRWDTLRDMPAVGRLLVDRGVAFENAFVVNPLCCPSRASLLTGRYSHGTGVYRQAPPFGGFASFDDSSTLATWFDGADYETAFLGKYLDSGQIDHLAGYVPPGWDEWAAFVHADYVDYTLSVNGGLAPYGSSPEDYSTDVLADRAVTFLESVGDAPAFMVVGVAAPHAPGLPAERHRDEPVRPWTPAPSFDEEDLSDKPPWMRGLPRIDVERRVELAALHDAQLRSLLAVDEAVERLVRTQRARGRLHDTVFVFTSDNGLLLGEHRWAKKEVPYEESIRVPLVVRYDRAAPPHVEADLVLNIDLAPTLADLAGVRPHATDGVSLRPLLEGRATRWRTHFLVEHLEGANPVTTYCALRTERYLYAVYRDGFVELYDLAADPNQLANVAGHDPALEARLRIGLETLCRPEPPDTPPIGRKLRPPDVATAPDDGPPPFSLPGLGVVLGVAIVAMYRHRISLARTTVHPPRSGA